MPLQIRKTGIEGVVVIDTASFEDHRGKFSRWFCEHELAEVMGKRRVVQINHSVTRAAGAIRGLHYQRSPDSDMKLVRCLKGRIFDVALDLRAGSPTFLNWHAEELTPENARMLVFPEGCAHGYQVLEPDTEALYLVSAPYAPDSERGVRYDDPRARITWPLPATDLSAKDLGWPLLAPGFSGLSP